MPRKAAAPKTDAQDPLADLRAPVGDPDPIDTQKDASAAADAPPAPPEEGEAPAVHIVVDDQAAVAAIVGAWHSDRYLGTAMHKGGVCQCHAMARKALESIRGHVTIQANESTEDAEGTTTEEATAQP